MAEFVTLSCPSCGGKLEITNDIERFACSYCGREHVVKRGGGVVSLAPIADAIHQVGVGVDRTAAELAIVRLKKELDEVRYRRRRLFESSPRPTRSAMLLFPVMVGIIVAIMGLSVDGGVNAALLLIGVAVFAAGAVPLFILKPPSTQKWDETTGVQLRTLDEQIARKKDELKRAHDIVSER